MASVIQQDFQASGVAPCIVILKRQAEIAAASRLARNLSKHFISSELSQESALAIAARSRASGRWRQPTAEARSLAEDPLKAAERLQRRPVVVQQVLPEAEPPPTVRFYPNLGVALGTVTREGLAALRADPQVERVVGAPRIELIKPARATGAQLRAEITWGIRRLGIPLLWEQGLSGQGVLVGHLDTGIDGAHPGLRQAISQFAEFDSFGRQVVPDPDPYDSGDHGTHTAGTIGGRPVRRRRFGVAPRAELASAMVIEGGQTVARVLGGMDWSIGLGVRVLSMSLGFPGWWEDFLPLTQILRQRGVLPVFAVGNEGAGTSRSPGNYPEALSVGAMDRLGDVIDFSSSQRFRRRTDPIVPDVVAPGVGVISARPGGGFQTMDGTSMATPHIAGLAALLLEAKPEATVEELERVILDSAALEPGWPPERAGRGLPNAPRALELLTGAVTA